jgi:seryl-tRNA synthetase
MHDVRIIRERLDELKAALLARGVEMDVERLAALDAERRRVLTEAEALKNERNVISKEIGRMRQAGRDTAERQAYVRSLGERIAELDARARRLEAERDAALLQVPNIPHSSVPIGADASANLVVRTWGAPPRFAFEPKSHVELCERLRLVDFARGARMTGTGFHVFTGAGARLERALIQFMLDLHTRRHGYIEVSPPFLCHAASMTGTGQLPKLADDMYYVETDGLYLIPTAEVPVTNYYREEIIAEPLPIKMTAYSPCFRREAGSAGRETRGLIRVHQFDKVEMVKFVEPETSYDELESLVRDAEEVLQILNVPYRVVLLCTGDLSFAAAKCYDIEIWASGQQTWLEVSSCSNFEDFQARRAGIRYRRKDGKPAFVHTLNGSGVALARLFVALLENGQQADGSILLPEALRPYLDGKDRIEPRP